MASSSDVSFVGTGGEYCNSCGYCGEQRCSWSYGTWAYKLQCSDYQDLLDRGWRRSGCWLYNPCYGSTCCTPHTIRTDALSFCPDKEHRRIMRKLTAFLEGGGRHPGACQANTSCKQTKTSGTQEPYHHECGLLYVPDRKKRVIALPGCDTPPQSRASTPPPPPALEQGFPESSIAEVVRAALAAATQSLIACGVLPAAAYPEARAAAPSAKQRKALPLECVLTSAAPLALAAAARRAVAGVEGAPAAPTADALAAALAQGLREAPTLLEGSTGLRVEALQGHLNFLVLPAPAGCEGSRLEPPAACFLKKMPAGTKRAEGAGREAICMEVRCSAGPLLHPAPPPPPLQPQPHPPQPPPQLQPGPGPGPGAGTANWRVGETLVRSHVEAGPSGQAPGGQARLEVVMVPMPAGPTLIALEFPLFYRYQTVQHKEPPHKVTERGFRRFLIDTPLAHVEQRSCPPGTCPPCGFGSFHQQYWLDGRLIAVGVVDILPRCLSSVYFFWEPELRQLALGKLSALQELAWVAAAQHTAPALRWLYMGYYIPTCHKMRYKADYHPAWLLCRRALAWVRIEAVAAALATNPACVLSEVPGALDGGQGGAGTSAVASGEADEGAAALSTLYYVLACAAQPGYLLPLRDLLRLKELSEAMRAGLVARTARWRHEVGPLAERIIQILDLANVLELALDDATSSSESPSES